jgi:hypothetical protein
LGISLLYAKLGEIQPKFIDFIDCRENGNLYLQEVLLLENNIYYDRCMDFLARMIEKYGDRIVFPDASEQNDSDKAGNETESSPSQFTYWLLTCIQAA